MLTADCSQQRSQCYAPIPAPTTTRESEEIGNLQKPEQALRIISAERFAVNSYAIE
jgi:hypothetical protein